MQSHSLCAAIVLSSAALFAQSTTVDYPDSVLTGPSGQYPVYTPPSGAIVRAQIFCPATFAGLPTGPMLVTRVGIQIAGQEDYTLFVGRAGTTAVKALTTTFATNLPDERVQFDLSGQKLPGGLNGSTAANQWVEFDLRHPFRYSPGDALVVDITAQSKVAGIYCRTAIGSGVPRMLNLTYTATTTTGSVYASGGIKLRFVFAPLYQPIAFGQGCSGTGNLTPKLSATGSTRIGATGVLLVNLTQGRPNAPAMIVASPFGIDLPIFGGCTIYPALSVLIPSATNGSGDLGTVFVVPNQPALDGASLTVQVAIDDPASAAQPLPFSLSNGLRLALNN
jgi:hypothetical protein